MQLRRGLALAGWSSSFIEARLFCYDDDVFCTNKDDNEIIGATTTTKTGISKIG